MLFLVKEGEEQCGRRTTHSLSPQRGACPRRVMFCSFRCLFQPDLPRRGRRGGALAGAWPGAGEGSLQPTTNMGSCLSPRVLEAWAQAAARARVQGAAITQFRQAASRRLLWTCWAQWRAVLLSGQLEPQEAEAQEACPVDHRQRPGVASRGRLLALMDTPAPWKQVR